MKTFEVFLKDQSKSVIVKADRCAEKDNKLRFFVDQETVADFNVSEVQGWHEVTRSH